MSDHESQPDPEKPSILDSASSGDETPSQADASGSESPSPSPTNQGSAGGESPVTDLNFEDDDLGENLRHASEDQLNSTSFGIIQVDDDGVVQFFNEYESELSGVDPEEAEGRNFFTQVAPCTNNRLFRGRFKKGVRRDSLDETFTYTYTYKMQPTLVDVHLYRDEAGHNWITVRKY